MPSELRWLTYQCNYYSALFLYIVWGVHCPVQSSWLKQIVWSPLISWVTGNFPLNYLLGRVGLQSFLTFHRQLRLASSEAKWSPYPEPRDGLGSGLIARCQNLERIHANKILVYRLVCMYLHNYMCVWCVCMCICIDTHTQIPTKYLTF